MLDRFAKKLNYANISLPNIKRFIQRELGANEETAMKYAVPLKNLLSQGPSEDLGTNNRLAETKTALKPMSPNKGPRKPPGYHQLHNDINVKPYCSCGICNSGVDCNGSACPNCGADSTNFVKGDPKTKRDQKNPTVAPQQIKNVPLMAARLDNKEKDDKKPLDKKLEPWSVNVGGEPTVEKSMSDPEVEENSDKNHRKSVEQTWKDLSGE